MRTRDKSGCYTEHLSPGDGTGFSNVPQQDAQAQQAESCCAADDVQGIDYTPRMRPVQR